MEHNPDDPSLLPDQRPSRSVIHKAVRNYLVNELGISRAKVMASVTPMVRDAVAELTPSSRNRAGIEQELWDQFMRKP